jgi:Na+/H+ antiporter NhaD/arsenite permease-like protein
LEALKIVGAGTDTAGNRLFQVQADLTLKRQITPAFWIASLVLLVVYILIAAELMHRTLAAFLGATLILFITYTAGTFDKNYFILSFEDAMRAIDLNVIFLLMGMMIIVGVLKKTGLFQWMAYKSYALARGNIFILSFILQIITAVTSAFLDNVTTMLLMIPVTIEIAVALKLTPLPC